MKNSLVFILVALATLSSWAVDVSPNARLTVITCSPGDLIYSCFGHTAIRYQDVVNGQGIDVVYNYGMFDSFEENFELKFMSGNLLYELGKEDFRQFQRLYAYEGRSLVEQQLNLSEADMQSVVDFLEENYLPENRKYHYHFFYDNCSTRVRDLLQSVLGERIHIPSIEQDGVTFRHMIDPYLQRFPWTDLGIDLILGMPTDKQVGPLEEAFLPDFLFDQMRRITVDGKPLVNAERELMPERLPPAEESTSPTVILWIVAVVLMILLIALQWVGRGSNIIRGLIWTVIGLLGLVMLLMWAATDHDTTRYNLNLLFASPLLLIVLFLKNGRVKTILLVLTTITTVLFILGWSILPQQFHPATIPMALMTFLANVTSGAFPFNPMAGLKRA